MKNEQIIPAYIDTPYGRMHYLASRTATMEFAISRNDTVSEDICPADTASCPTIPSHCI